MYKPCVFIISKRKELSVKYKKLIESLNCDVFVTSKLSDAIGQIKTDEPELILVSDTIDENLSDFLKKVRVLTYNFRPVLIAVSKSNELSDRLTAFDCGADDFLDETMASKEFQARINAHIRRQIENSINRVTGFIDNKLTLKSVKKSLKNSKDKAYVLVNISGINFYKEIYGEIAYEKVLQTLGAIIVSTLSGDDIAGQYSYKELLLITSSSKAEKIAEFLTFAFDNILDRFYSEFDFQNNFMLFSSDSIEEKKIPLMKLSVSVLSGGSYKDEKEVINLLFGLIKLTKDSKKSSYIVDRPKLKGEVIKKEPKNKVLIMEPDEALNCLLDTACTINGISVKSCLQYENFKDIYDDFMPDVIVIDYGNKYNKEGFEAINNIKKDKNYQNPKIIFSTNIQDKTGILAHGADLYLPKPYDINTMIKWIKNFLNE